MDLQFWVMLFKIIICLPFVLILIYISAKFGGNKLQNIQNGKYIKILERTPISKENSLLVVKIGDKGYVLSSTVGKISIISELNKDEISNIEASKTIPQYADFKDFYRKLKFKKEDKDE
ncbi:flagellar biosynthetic protein FliO [Clostridium sp. JS66]|uniref:flagellar biosynthetic protein FliO n=1 Tax=Clostridium sp. JS66 TaxID=3064705 RepID=UPI00298DE390|nr:flagellar biosynthetic protein FliO [Clostridium sp. JS66]WPC40991.1 flagellar biosynthetic protein FliO [Clostridium sp. JS66]